MSQNELVSLTIQEMFRPCLYTALTTMVAFASLSISDIKPVIEFGKMMVMGILFAFIFTFTVLPSIMSLINKLSSDSEKDFSKGLTLHFASYTSKNGKVVVTQGNYYFPIFRSIRSKVKSQSFAEVFFRI